MAALSVTSFLVTAVGATWYVDKNHAPPCTDAGPGTPANPFCSIQKGICAAGAGDTVIVAPGIYLESLRMKPEVIVLSQAGPVGTTINAHAQPCVDQDFCTRGTQAQCTGVIFSTGHTPTSRLEGFTITGGEGLIQSNRVVGGGMVVFSSPTITNNIITNNALSGPPPQGHDLRGAGVYVAIGAPQITNNTITSNTAVPPAGSASITTFAYGGGLWLRIGTAAKVSDNIIQGNIVGSPGLEFSLNNGAGIMAFPGTDPNLPMEIDRNLIADNEAEDRGGGIAMIGFPSSVSKVLVRNNIIVGNHASFNGGGVYQYLSPTSIINNTIHDNESLFGAGIYSGFTDPNTPVTIANNIVQDNRITQIGGFGGGLYSLDEDTNTNIVVRNNNLFGNQNGQCAGMLTDASCNGVNDNISADSLFVDEVLRDYRLQLGSSSIDRAHAAMAPATDIDLIPRIDGDGAVDSPVIGDVDMGAHESTAFCQTVATESCNGVDDDCDVAVDEGFPNADGDAMADCVDEDDDNDEFLDASDCAPLDAAAFTFPQNVAGFDVTRPNTSLAFTLQNIGSSATYDVVSGVAGRLQTVGGFAEMYCLKPGLTVGTWLDPDPAPDPGNIRYYMIRAKNNCGDGTLGSAQRDAPGDVCQLGIVDQDNDGSPSTLDCADNDAARSPLHAEVCDSIDNNCNGVPDDGIDLGGACEGLGACGAGVNQCFGGGTICSTEPGGTQNQSQPETCDSLDNDCDGAVDDNLGQTSCGLGVCQRTVNNCVDGVTQTCTPGSPTAEVCDGIDNNCNGVADDGFPDTDLDNQNDCLDTDDDNDGRPDSGDCAPLDDTAFAQPFVVQGVLMPLSSPTQITWTTQSLGSGTQYVVSTGLIGPSPGSIDFPAGVCLDVFPGGVGTDPRLPPAVDGIYYYMVKSRNACSGGTFGTPLRDTHPGCP